MTTVLNDIPGATTAQEDAERIRDLHIQWIWGWDKAPGASWDFRQVQGRFYDWTFDGCRLYDDMDPELRIVRSAEEYRSIWEPVFQAVREAKHGIEDGPEVLVSGDLASSWLVFIARIIAADGSTTVIRTHNSLVWRRSVPDGWSIVGDHTTSRAIGGEEADQLLAALPNATTWTAHAPGAQTPGGSAGACPPRSLLSATGTSGTAS
jgi:hypothetical protein